MPNAGLPELGLDGAALPAHARRSWPTRTTRFTTRVRAVAWSAAAAAPRPSTCAQVVERGAAAASCARRSAAARAGRRLALPARAVPPGHLVPGDRRADQRQRLQGVPRGDAGRATGTTAWRSPAAQIRDGAHLLDVCVDYVGRDGVADMTRGRRPVRHRLDPADRARLHRARRSSRPAWSCSAAAPSSTRSTTRTATARTRGSPGSCRWSREHGAAVIALTIDEQGQARTAEWKVADRRPADRRPDRQLGHAASRTSSSTASPSRSPPARRRPGGTASRPSRRSASSSARYPDVQTTLGLSNVSFGLNPAARQVLNSVFLHECVAGRPGLGHRARLARSCRSPGSPRSSAQVALDLVYDRRRDGLRPAAAGSWSCSRACDAAAVKAARAAELAGLPLCERLKRRIIDGERNGLEADLDEAPDASGPRWRSSTTCCWTA